MKPGDWNLKWCPLVVHSWGVCRINNPSYFQINKNIPIIFRNRWTASHVRLRHLPLVWALGSTTYCPTWLGSSARWCVPQTDSMGQSHAVSTCCPGLPTAYRDACRILPVSFGTWKTSCGLWFVETSLGTGTHKPVHWCISTQNKFKANTDMYETIRYEKEILKTKSLEMLWNRKYLLCKRSRHICVPIISLFGIFTIYCNHFLF